MNNLQRPSPEIERRLKTLEKGINTNNLTSPSPIKYDGTSWVPTAQNLYIAYAEDLDNLDSDGKITNQSDADGFGYTPFSVIGVLHPFRGTLVTTALYASGDPTDYIWESTGGVTGVDYVRYWSKDAELLVNMGDPDNHPSDIHWYKTTPTEAGNGFIREAFWIADKYTIEGVESGWNIYPVKTGISTNIGLISGNMGPWVFKPELNSAQWKSDVLVVARTFTGLSYSTHTELGHGSTVAIQYSDGKMYGTLKEVFGVDKWVTAGQIIEGGLVVDGSITTDHIAANTITADNISANTITSNEIEANAIKAVSIDASSITVNKIPIGELTTSTSESISVSGKNPNVKSFDIPLPAHATFSLFGAAKFYGTAISGATRGSSVDYGFTPNSGGQSSVQGGVIKNTTPNSMGSAVLGEDTLYGSWTNGYSDGILSFTYKATSNFATSVRISYVYIISRR